MYSIERIESLIISSEATLAKNEILLKENPRSLFNTGIVKNTNEQLAELRSNLAFEKQKREKEIIDLRLKGKMARVGKLPLDLLGSFATSLSECIVEASRKYQYGNKTGAGLLSSVKKTIDLRFDRLVPGSTHILITGNTSPDLFGNSMIESALKSTFGLLNVSSPSELIEQSEIYGGQGIKKLKEILSISLKNELEFDLEWDAPNAAIFRWEGDREKIKTLHNSISKIEIDDPQEIAFSGTLLMQSLKGQIELLDKDKKTIKVSFPMNMLDTVKALKIGDSCTGSVIRRVYKNTMTNDVRNTFELKEIFSV